jgi:hypothetical protein
MERLLGALGAASYRSEPLLRHPLETVWKIRMGPALGRPGSRPRLRSRARAGSARRRPSQPGKPPFGVPVSHPLPPGGGGRCRSGARVARGKARPLGPGLPLLCLTRLVCADSEGPPQTRGPGRLIFRANAEVGPGREEGSVLLTLGLGIETSSLSLQHHLCRSWATLPLKRGRESDDRA